MVDIEDALTFYQSYLDADHAGSVASRSEPDETLDACRAKVMSFMHSVPGVVMSPGFGRQKGYSAAKLAQMAQWTDFVRRPLFLVAEYARPDGHRLFAAYIGGNRPMTAGSYSELLFATEIDGELKIIASFGKEFDSVPPPVRWSHTQGARIEGLGAPVSVRPLLAPTLDAHRQDWEALRDMTSN